MNRRFKRICSLIISLLILNSINAQQLGLEWWQKFGDDDWDYVNDLHEFEGNYILGGSMRIKNLTLPNSKKHTDAWVSFVDSNGNKVWEKLITGHGFKTVTSITDANRNIVITGLFQDTISVDSVKLSSESFMSAFLLKLDEYGTPNFIKRIGDKKTIIENALIDTDPNGNIYNAIEFSGELNLSDNNYSSIAGSNSIIVYQNNNGFLLNPVQIKSSGILKLTGFAIKDSSFFVSGSFSDSLFVTDTVFSSSYDSDSFIAKIDNSGNLLWIKFICGRGAQDINDFYVAENNIGITGSFENNIFFDSIVLQSFGNKDLFICLLDLSGNFIWNKNIGSISDDHGYSICLKNNNLFVSGSYTHVIGIPDANGNLIQYKAFSPFGNSFIAKYDYLGNLKASYNLPGTTEDYCQRIYVDSAGMITTAGNFHDKLKIEKTNNEFVEISSSGDKDIFLLHFDDLCKDFQVEAGPDTSICQNSSIFLEPLSTTTFNSYTWQPGGEVNIPLEISEQGIYYLTAMNELGCISKDSLIVTVNQPDFLFAGNDTLIEACNSIELASAYGNMNSWHWYTNGSGYFANEQLLNTSYIFSNDDISAGGVTLSLSGSGLCGTISDSLIIAIPFDDDGILVYPNPASANTTVICEEGQVIQSVTITTQSGLVISSTPEVYSISFSFDLSAFPPGTFIYYISTNLGTTTKTVNKI